MCWFGFWFQIWPQDLYWKTGREYFLPQSGLPKKSLRAKYIKPLYWTSELYFSRKSFCFVFNLLFKTLILKSSTEILTLQILRQFLNEGWLFKEFLGKTEVWNKFKTCLNKMWSYFEMQTDRKLPNLTANWLIWRLMQKNWIFAK